MILDFHLSMLHVLRDSNFEPVFLSYRRQQLFHILLNKLIWLVITVMYILRPCLRDVPIGEIPNLLWSQHGKSHLNIREYTSMP